MTRRFLLRSMPARSLHNRTMPKVPLLLLAAALIGGGGVCATGCSNVEKSPPRPRAANPDATVLTDLPPIMSGTVASVARLDGWRDVIVHGYGLVVNLNGTGHRTMHAQIRADMIAEMARRGVGSEASGFTISPEQLLDSMDTAVVVVKAIIPPGSSVGDVFDVHISKLPNTETTSLEGGLLWTVDLRPALTAGLPPAGGRGPRPLAQARGRIFTNPFVEPGVDGVQAGTPIDTTTGRIIGGGRVIREIPLKLRLASPSHNLASILQQMINSHFPQEPGQTKPTARGEGAESIEITVPPSFRSRQQEFLRLLEHTSINPTGVEVAVEYVNRMVEESPGHADRASWRWQAMGRQILPAIKKFYTIADERPRYAALRAGARLNDPLVVPHLLDLAKSGSPGIRKEAMRLLGEMRPDPRIVLELKELLNDPSTDIRVAAYEALESQRTTLISTLIVDNKYRVDFVESERPLIYIALLEEPRIVVFGRDLEVDRPMTLAAWSNRLLMKGDSGEETLEVAFRDGGGQHLIHHDVPARLSALIPFLGHTSTIERPQPGLGLNYSETIGVLYAIHQARYLGGAEFITEADRLRLAILDRERDPGTYEERPEFEIDRPQPTTGGSESGSAGDLGPTDEGDIEPPRWLDPEF